MTHFTDSIAGRTMAVITDSFVVSSGLWPNGDDAIEEDGSQTRAYRAVDSASGVNNVMLPNWGVTDFTMQFLARKTGFNLNPSGFTNYWCMAITDNAYNNEANRMYCYASGNSALSVKIGGAPAMICAMSAINTPYMFTLTIESSNLSGGRYSVYRNGIRTAEGAHGLTVAPTYAGTGHYFQRGGRNGASDFGILSFPFLGKIACWDREITDTEMQIARAYYMVG